MHDRSRLLLGKKRKVDLYSAYRQYSTTKHSDVDHTVLPANTPHLPVTGLILISGFSA